MNMVTVDVSRKLTIDIPAEDVQSATNPHRAAPKQPPISNRIDAKAELDGVYLPEQTKCQPKTNKLDSQMMLTSVFEVIRKPIEECITDELCKEQTNGKFDNARNQCRLQD